MLLGLMKKARISFKPVSAMTSGDFDETWAFVDQFVNWTRDAFVSSAQMYEELMTFRAGGALVGIGFITHLSIGPKGSESILILTSLIFVKEAYRGQNLVQKAGLRSFLRQRLKHPKRPIYWLFMARSYKSYLLLSRNFETYWPRPGAEFPADMRALLDEAATRVHGDLWDARRGLLLLSKPSPWRDGQMDLDERVLMDPHARYFEERAPRWRTEEALGCLCPLTLGNWLSLGRKWVGRLRRTPGAPRAARVRRSP
jgi:hypothetical protein